MTLDPLRYFRIEARELVEKLEAGLIAYEKQPESLPELFRSAHTLKGAARVCRQDIVADLSHAMEDVFAHHREAGSALSQQEVRELLALVDGIRSEFDKLAPARTSDGAALQTAEPAPAQARPDFETTRVALGEMDALATSAHDAAALAATLRQKLAASASRNELLAVADELELELKHLGEHTNVLRLLDAAVVFPELERAAYDAAALSGKEIAFTSSASHVKLDGHVLGPLRAALIHLVRNAVGHGIEPAATREAAGKPALGQVEVVVARRGARIAFSVRDDGAGIDVAAVRRRAAAQGLGDEDALELIFRPGFSTASDVSALSGRGVGLDAVRDAVWALKGTIEVRSEPGQGTTFELVVPVSLSSLRALAVEIAGRAALVPMDAVVATVRLQPENCLQRGDGRVVLYGQGALPLHELAAWLAPNAEYLEPRVAIIQRTSRGLVALAADRLLGTRDVIVRPLPRAAGRSALVLGAALDAQGKPNLVLDAEGLSDARRAQAPAAPPAKERRILVIDDSLTTRILEQSILEAAGYEVDVASSAEEGLDQAGRRQYGLFVVDVEMPGMNGYDFTRETRRRPTTMATPVIMVTSLASEASRRRGAEAGVSAYVVKGAFDQGSFLATVQGLLT